MKTKLTAGAPSRIHHLLSALAIAAVATFFTTPQVEAQTNILTNPITATDPSLSNPFTSGQVVAANITASGIGRGAGISANAGSNRYNANSWNTASIDLTAYFTFTLTPNSGFEIDFNSFVYAGQASGSGPTSFAFRSSVDSFASNIGTPTASGTTISLSGASYQNITSAIEFRLYGWGASSSAGTFSVNEFGFTGLVNSTGGGGTDYYWTGNGTTLGGSGTWATTGNTWSVTNTPVVGVVWDSTKKAIFTNSADTVTVSTVSANAGIQFATTGYSLTNGTLTLGGASAGLNSIATDSGVTATIGSTLAGTAGMTKNGAGTLVLSGANGLSGGLNIANGGVSVSAANNLGTAGNDVNFAGGTLVTTGSFETDSGVDFTGTGTIDIAGGTSLTNNGAFNMSALTLTNTGTLVLNGATRSVGNLAFTAGGTVSGSGPISATGLTADNLTSGTATINPAINFATGAKNTTVGAGGNLVLNGDITGLGGGDRITKLGVGTLVVNGANSGAFRLGAAGTTNGGTLVIGTPGSLGTNTFRYNWGTLVAAAPMTITNALSIGGREASQAAVGGTSAIEFSGPVTWFGTAGVNHQLDVNNASTFSGVIASAATTDTKLVFGGAGTLTMSGSAANTFTNDLILTNTLTVNLNKDEDVTAVAGNVTVNTGATLLISASGMVSDTSEVTLSGGTLARGTGVSESFGDLTLTSNSFLNYGGGVGGTFEFSGLNYTPSGSLVLNLANFTAGSTLVINSTSDWTSLIGTAFTFSGSGGFGSSSFSSGTFTITAVPEPSTYVAAAGLLALMAWPVRRRLVRDAKSIFGLRAPMRDRLARKA